MTTPAPDRPVARLAGSGRRLASALPAVALAVLSLTGCGESPPAPAATADDAPPAGETASGGSSDDAPGSTVPGSTVPGSTVPGSTVPGSTASGATVPAIRLEDVTEASGLEMVMTCGVVPATEILEVNGGGLALLDYDGDGFLDVFVANGATMAAPDAGPGSRLFRNLGPGADGGPRFEDATSAAGIDLTAWATGVAAGDVDGDGRDDLFVACYGPNVLLRNRGDGTFEDVSEIARVDDDRWSTSAAFGDFDGDGDLDLYVVNYVAFDVDAPPPRASHKGIEVMAGPHGLPAQADQFLENLGDGIFRDASEEAGILVRPPAYGLNLVVADFDGDDRQDVVVGNDSMANFWFRNVGAPGGPIRFEEIGVRSGLASNGDGSNQATMGMAVADVDGNGRPDLFSTNFSNDTNTLHLNAGDGFFDDGTRRWGLGIVSRPFLGWACWFVDLDHDADEDLVMFNGHVYPQATAQVMDSAFEQPPLLFERRGDRFHRVTDADAAGAWLDRVGRDRCAAFGDLDRDGDVDVVFGGLDQPVRVLRNLAIESAPADAPPRWLVVALEDARPGPRDRRGHGAVITLESASGGTTSVQRRWIVGGGGFQSSSAPEAHFALPPGTERWTLRVRWPDGAETALADRPADELGRRIVVRRAD